MFGKKFVYLVKLKVMEKLNLIELNNLYYCVGKVKSLDGVKMISDEECEKLLEKIIKMIDKRGKEIGR